MNGMITILIWATVAVGVSFLCSVIEAVMLSLSDAQVAAISSKNPKLGFKWEKYKEDISTPLFGVLTLNTISHTAGAGGVGAATLEAYGESSVAIASAILTFFILVFSELIPKTIGEKYAKPLAGPVAHAVFAINLMTYPIVKPINYIRSLFPDDDNELLEIEDVHGMIELAGDAGVIQTDTETILNNVLVFSRSSVGDLMTPIQIVETAEIHPEYKIVKHRMKMTKCPIKDTLGPNMRAKFARGDEIVETVRIHHKTPAMNMKAHMSRHDLVFVTDEMDETVGILCREDILDALLARPTLA